MSHVLTVPHLGTSTCPLCQKEWLVTPSADCLLPECDCYGHDTSAVNPSRPCHECGIGHALTCEEMPSRRKDRRETA